ncbi:MAG TPA: hypothetical protein VJ724_13025 [Tahibacter sp.]|nr:hypothetical protein [Tahibacter sp.]
MAVSILALAEGAQPLAALLAPLLWFASPAFRARTRERWQRDGRRARIAEVMAWCLAWLFAGIVAGLVVAFGL